MGRNRKKQRKLLLLRVPRLPLPLMVNPKRFRQPAILLMHKKCVEASKAAVSKHLSSDGGRRLSNLEKGLYVVDKAIELANQEEQEDVKLGIKDDEVEEVVKDKNWKFLPYEPVLGDTVDELLAEQLNIFEIDIDIRPIQLKKKKKRRGKGGKDSKKIFYRIQGKKKRVRCIHGVLLVKKKDQWVELIPKLRKLCGLPDLGTEAAIAKKKKKKREVGNHFQ